jgi:predicted nucleic-acid-binding protein
MVCTRAVVVDDIDAVIDALQHFRRGGDLADQLIWARAARAAALPVVSFDHHLAAVPPEAGHPLGGAQPASLAEKQVRIDRYCV